MRWNRSCFSIAFSFFNRTECRLPSSQDLCTVSISGRLESYYCRPLQQFLHLMSVQHVSLFIEDFQPWYAANRLKRLSYVVYPHISRSGREFLKGRDANSDVHIQKNGGSDKRHVWWLIDSVIVRLGMTHCLFWLLGVRSSLSD